MITHIGYDHFRHWFQKMKLLGSGLPLNLPGVLWWTFAIQTEQITESETKTIENIKYFDTSGMSVEVLFWVISLVFMVFMRKLQNYWTNRVLWTWGFHAFRNLWFICYFIEHGNLESSSKTSRSKRDNPMRKKPIPWSQPWDQVQEKCQSQ